MKLEEKKIVESGEGISIVTIEKEEWEEKLRKAKNRIANNIAIPGFRKGKAPKAKIEQYITMPKILKEAASIVVEPAWKFALDNKKTIEPFSSPSPSIKELTESLCKIEFSFDLKPQIKIAKYQGIKLSDVVKEKAEVLEEDLTASIEAYRDRFAMEKEKADGEKVALGDSVIFDYEGFINGEPFRGGKASNFTLVIGKKQMIPGFEEAMVGLGKGEGTITVTFPDDYTPELSGKTAEFKLNIHTIKERQLPAVDEDFVKDLNIEGINTVEELKTELSTRILAQKEDNNKKQFVASVIKEIAKNSELIIPKSAILEQVNKLFQEFEQNLAAKRMTIAAYKKETGLTEQQIREELFSDAKERLESYLVTDAVRNNEKFEIDEKRINAKYEELAKNFGMKAKDIRNKLINYDVVKEELMKEEIINYLYEKNG